MAGYMYDPNTGDQILVEKEQVKLMEEAGYVKNPPSKVKSTKKPVEETEEEDETEETSKVEKKKTGKIQKKK